MKGSSRSTVHLFLQNAQTIALVAAGCWVIFRYLAHEREAIKLSIEQQRLSNSQAAVVASTQRGIEEARLKSLELDNEQRRLASSIQDKQQSLTLAQQKLTLEQSRLALGVAESQRKLHDAELANNVELQRLQAELQKLQTAKLRHDVDVAGDYRLERGSDLKQRRHRSIGGDLFEYELEFSSYFTNRGSATVEISACVVDVYVGTPVATSAGGIAVRHLNIPNLRNTTLKPRPDDAISWRLALTSGSMFQDYGRIYKSARRPHWSYDPRVDFTLNLLGTGGLKSNERRQFIERYLVTAPKNSYVVAFMAFCVNDCRPGPDGFTQWDIVVLGEDARQEKSIVGSEAPPD